MKHKALEVLQKIVALKEETGDGRRVNRLVEFLKPYDSPDQHDWFFYVPLNFNEALDIKLLQRMKDKVPYWAWTQGGWFYFKQGDVLYDAPQAYENWHPKGMNFQYCLRIDSSTQAVPATQTKKRFSGMVDFTLLVPQNKTSSLIPKENYSLTQDDFVYFLITGHSTPLTLNKKAQEDLWTH